jgi:hypothetical protein
MGQLTPVNLQSSANVNIDKNDIIAIQVAKAERHLNELLSAAQATMKTRETELKLLLGELETSYQATAVTATTKLIADLQAIKTEGFDVPALGKPEYRETNDGSGLVVGVAIGDKNSYNRLALSKTVPYSDSQKTLRATITTTKEQLSAAQTEVVAAKQRLNKLPTLERQYRAALAEKTLASTEEGKALLDAISSDASTDVLALPAS